MCLIPEIPFELDVFLEYVDSVMAKKGNCIVCVAEGAGQELARQHSNQNTDASGNPILHDIGTFLRDRCVAYSTACSLAATVSRAERLAACRIKKHVKVSRHL